MSAVTLPPWLSPWSTGLVYGARARKPGERARAHRPRLTIYTYGHGNSAPILRFSSWSEDGSGAGPGEGAGGPGGGGAGVASAPPPAVRWERVPLDHEPWHVEVPVPIQPRPLDRPHPYDVTIHSDMEFEPPAAGGSALAAWGGVVRGWAAGAALLALLVVIVRVGERFLDWKILLRRRRLHREWQRANVSATSRLDGLHPLPAELPDDCSVELPPPYSACAAPKADDRHEEPPPPYSACVQLVNKNGPVILYSREAQRRVDRILRGLNSPDAAAAAPAAPRQEDADEHVRLTIEIDRILRVCGVNVTEPPPSPPAERLSVYDQLLRTFPSLDEGPPRYGSGSPRTTSYLDERNGANAAADQPIVHENIDSNIPTETVRAECQDDAPNEADEGPSSDVPPTYAGVDPLGVTDVTKDGSVVV